MCARENGSPNTDITNSRNNNEMYKNKIKPSNWNGGNKKNRLLSPARVSQIHSQREYRIFQSIFYKSIMYLKYVNLACYENIVDKQLIACTVHFKQLIAFTFNRSNYTAKKLQKGKNTYFTKKCPTFP